MACSFRIGTLSSSARASKKNTLANFADTLSCRSTRATTVVIVDVSLPLEVEAGKTCRYMESPDSVFSCYLKMATACGPHVVHECVDAAYSQALKFCRRYYILPFGQGVGGQVQAQVGSDASQSHDNLVNSSVAMPRGIGARFEVGMGVSRS